MVAANRDLDKLQKLQYVALRIVLKADPRSSIYELHESCKMDTLAVRREKSLLKLCYKWVHGDELEKLCKIMLPPPDPPRQTRQTCNTTVQIPRVKSSMGEKTIMYRAPRCWGMVKKGFTSCTKYEQLKRKLKVVLDTFD